MSAVKMITPPVTAKWCNLDEFASFDGVSSGKYTVTFYADQKHLQLFEQAVKEAGGGQGNNPISIVPDDSQYDAGMVRFKGSSKYPIKVVDKSGNVCENHLVEGATVQAAIAFAPYQAGPNRGVTIYLNGIRVLKEGGAALDFGDLPEGYEEDDLPF